MKKFNFLVLLLALVGLATSCSQDDSIDLQNSENNRVTLSANLQSDLQTRANGNLQVTGYSLRYILEVWNAYYGTVAYREEKLVTDASQSVPFEFYLSETGEYKALLWADYILEGAAFTNGHYSDYYYTTNAQNGLKAISILGANYVVNTPSRDAFFGSLDIQKQSTSTNAGLAELKRPFGRINFVEKDVDMLKELTSLDLTYDVPLSFNVSDGSASGTYSVDINLDQFPIATQETANMFYDYILTSSESQEILGAFKIDYTLKDGKTGTFNCPYGFPVQRNYRTNLSGNMIKVPNTTLEVEVNDNWASPDYGENLQ